MIERPFREKEREREKEKEGCLLCLQSESIIEAFLFCSSKSLKAFKSLDYFKKINWDEMQNIII
jgi:hypothetical protein